MENIRQHFLKYQSPNAIDSSSTNNKKSDKRKKVSILFLFNLLSDGGGKRKVNRKTQNLFLYLFNPQVKEKNKRENIIAS